jgi:hypothetical protein
MMASLFVSRWSDVRPSYRDVWVALISLCRNWLGPSYQTKTERPIIEVTLLCLFVLGRLIDTLYVRTDGLATIL